MLFAVSAAFAAVIGGTFAADMRTPAVIVLGSGSRLSVLVTAGSARLLLATGDDPVALGNALDLARHPTTRRIDILLVAGQARDLQAPAVIAAGDDDRFTARIGPSPDGSVPSSLQGAPSLPAERRFRLPGDVTIVTRWGSGADDRAGPVWAAVISRGSSSIAVLSEGRAVTLLGSVAAVNAIIVAGGDSLEALKTIDAGAIVMLGTEITGKELRQSSAALDEVSLWGARVFPGEAFQLTFSQGAVTVPSGAVQQLSVPSEESAAPTAEPPAPATDGPDT